MLAATRTSYAWNDLPGNFDRLNTRALFASDNEWGIPTLPAVHWQPDHLVAYNSRRDCLKAGSNAAVHFFLDDYRFETVWTKPERGLSRIALVGSALTPDFSMWRDMPVAMQLWQVYRARWCGAWMLQHGTQVIPTLSWSGAESLRFAFLGVARGSNVAVSTVGVSRDREAKRYFYAGWEQMVARLAPSTVLVYGKLLPGLDAASIASYPTRWEVQDGRPG